MDLNFIIRRSSFFLLLCSLFSFTNARAGLPGTPQTGLRLSSKVSGSKTYYDSIPSKSQQDQGNWQMLFDGKDISQWRETNSERFPSGVWAVEGGCLFVQNHKGGKDIITRDKYGNFELVFQFKLTRLANSGIKYLVDQITNTQSGKKEWNGPEYQIIDDYNHPAVKGHIHDEGSTGAFYLVYAPRNKHLNPAGEWNQGKIIVRGAHVEHWLNGVKIVSYERGTSACRQLISKTKFSHYDHYGELPEGHIMLTDHGGDKVYYRNIKIRRME